jgi:hypothetical protein
MSDDEQFDSSDAKRFAHAIIPDAIQWVCWIFAFASFSGAIYRVCNIMARHGDIDQIFGATTLSYLGAAVGFLLLPYAKSFGILGAKVDLNLEEKQTQLSLKFDDLRKLIRNDRETDDAPRGALTLLHGRDNPLRLISEIPGANEFSSPLILDVPRSSHFVPEIATTLAESEASAAPPTSDEVLIRAAKAIRAGNVDDDPWKGQFGGFDTDKDNKRKLSATVSPIRRSSDYFDVCLTVSSTDPAKPLEGSVYFFIHDSFPNPKRLVEVANGVATLELESWGAFTVGALADEGRTRLELDLAEDPSFPRKFRSR